MKPWPRTIAPQPAANGAPAPLRGASLLWTRPEEGGDAMAESLAAAGAEVLVAPAIEFRELSGSAMANLLEMIDHLRQWRGWLALPSPAAVRFFVNAMDAAGLKCGMNGRPEWLGEIRIAVIGAGSAAALEEAGLHPDFIPTEPTGAGLARELPGEAAPVLIAGSGQSRPELQEGLKRRGFRVQKLALYETRPCAGGLEAIAEILARRPETLVVAASPSAAEAIADWFDARERPRPAARWVAIGPTTRQRLIDLGVAPERIARAASPDAAALAAAAAHLLARPGAPEAGNS